MAFRTPLCLQVDHSSGSTKFLVTYNGKVELVDPPFRPYFLDHHQISPSVELMERRLLSSGSVAKVVKNIVNNTSLVRDMRNNNSFESNIPFDVRVMIDDPEFLEKYSQTERLKVMYLDIETDSYGGVFPRSSENPIIAIGYAINDEPCQSLLSATLNDKQILEQFIDVLKREDPDIIVTYNGSRFDLPYISERLMINKIPSSSLSRCNQVLRTEKVVKENVFNIPGRAHLDLFHHVKMDQTLSGIKNNQLDTVCEFKEIGPIFNLDTDSMRNYVGKPELKKYVENDIHLTRELSKSYLPLCNYLAQVLRIPINHAYHYGAFFLSTILIGRKLHALGYVSDGSNEQRYPNIYPNKEDDEDDTKLQGAFVKLYKSGRFAPAYKIDFSSQYPTLMTTFNLSPETIFLIGEEPIADFKITKSEKSLVLSIPDENFNRNFLVRINMEKEGVVPGIQRKLKEKRRELKSEMKTLNTKSPEYAALNSSQNAVKVLMNSIFGYSSNKHAHFGNTAMAIAIMGLGRFSTKQVVGWLEDSVVETDTDGIIMSKTVDVKEINERLSRMITNESGLKCDMVMDLEEYQSSYFYKAKNYFLRTKKGDIIIHGGALKDRRKPALFDKAVREIANCLLDGKKIEEKIVDIFDFKKYDFEDFIQSQRLTQPVESYVNKKSMGPKLAMEAFDSFGIVPETGRQYYYVTTRVGYHLAKLSKKEDLDLGYYREMLNTLVNNLGFNSDGSERKETKQLVLEI